uniref:type II toxin-antitoxin system RelE/ParE family toxin n=1 Tax=uncultured Caulobacter sp. TaxID=158749 RepID=UPI0025D9FCF8|nr:type II toxin-antitoxin system RelE/ParE family toxin [uncultured Caulobacter sp.]
MRPVRLSALAQNDIQRIVEDIGSDKPRAAAAVGRQLIQRCHGLANAPEGYELRPEFGVDVRGVTVPPYVILYRVRRHDTLVLGVRHGARRPVVFK